MNGREHRDRELTRLSALRLFLFCLDSLGSCAPPPPPAGRRQKHKQLEKPTFFIEKKKERLLQKVYFQNRTHDIPLSPGSSRMAGVVCGLYCSCSAPLPSPSPSPSLPGCSGIWVLSAAPSSFVVLSDVGAPSEGSCSIGVSS